MILRRPVKQRAAESAIMLASVPELVKRTRSRLKRRVTVSGEGHFATVVGAEIDAGLQRFRDGCLDARMRMPVDAGRILAQQIDIVMSVHIGDPGPFGPGHTDRERRGEEDGARVATRHDPGGAILHRLRIWMSGHIAGNGLGQGVVQAVGPVPVHHALCPPMGGVNCSPMSQGR